jgi:hypothetical protein
MERISNMRLNEFTNPTKYTSADIDTAAYLRQIEKLWPQSIGDDDAPFVLRLKRRPQNDRLKPMDER